MSESVPRPPRDSDATAQYRRQERRRGTIVLGATILVCGCLALDIATGPADLTLADVASTLLRPESASPSHRTIIWTFRLPTALMALVVGASLGVAGAEMQTILNNPLASPFTLGISAAASFGAALVLVFGSFTGALASTILVPGSAFLWAMLCSFVIFGIGRFRGGTTETVVVGGVALHFIFSSGVAFLQYIASEDTLQAIVFWIFGSLQGASWDNVAVIVVVLLGTTVWLSRRAWQLTALRLGDDHARSLGVPVARLRLQTLMLISILTAVAVCFTGAIASKAMVPGTIFPIGIATAAIGAPFFAGIALLRRRAYW